MDKKIEDMTMEEFINELPEWEEIKKTISKQGAIMAEISFTQDVIIKDKAKIKELEETLANGASSFEYIKPVVCENKTDKVAKLLFGKSVKILKIKQKKGNLDDLDIYLKKLKEFESTQSIIDKYAEAKK